MGEALPACVPFRAFRDYPPIALLRAPDRALAGRLRDDPSLREFGRVNRMESVVAHALADGLGWPDVPAAWREAHDTWDRRIRAHLAELDAVAAAFARDGIALIVLKNGGIARALHPCAGCCPMGDIDGLVPPPHFLRAHEILTGLGFRIGAKTAGEPMDLEFARRTGVGEYLRELPGIGTMVFELHWRPVSGQWLTPAQEPDVAALFARSVPVAGTAVRLLHPVDNLLQVAMHTAKHTYVRAPGFRLHFDVHRIAPHVADWDLFIARARASGIATAVYFSLAIPHLLLGTPVPREVLRALRPPAARGRLVTRLLDRAGPFGPDRRHFSRPAYVLLHALLYDSPRTLLRAMFPTVEALQRRYEFAQRLLSAP